MKIKGTARLTMIGEDECNVEFEFDDGTPEHTVPAPQAAPMPALGSGQHAPQSVPATPIVGVRAPPSRTAGPENGSQLPARFKNQPK